MADLSMWSTWLGLLTFIESPNPHCAQPCFKDHQSIKNNPNVTDRVMQLGGTSQMKALILGFTLKPSITSYWLSLPKFSLSNINNHIPKPHHELSVVHPNCKKTLQRHLLKGSLYRHVKRTFHSRVRVRFGVRVRVGVGVWVKFLHTGLLNCGDR